MRKFTRTDEQAEVLSPDAHQAVQDELHKQGKTSAQDIHPGQQSLLDVVDENEPR